jgi:hypothetical protein
MLEALAGFVASFLASLAKVWLAEMRRTSADNETGRLRAELAHCRETLGRERAMHEIALRGSTRETLLQRLGEGGA